MRKRNFQDLATRVYIPGEGARQRGLQNWMLVQTVTLGRYVGFSYEADELALGRAEFGVWASHLGIIKRS